VLPLVACVLLPQVPWVQPNQPLHLLQGRPRILWGQLAYSNREQSTDSSDSHCANGTNRAADGSNNSTPAVHTSTHIYNAQSDNDTQRRLGSYDATKHAYMTCSPYYGMHTITWADPLQVKDYRNILKKGQTSSFVPEHFLLRKQEKKNNSSLSYTSIAGKGVKPGAKITPRSLKDLLPSWNETWTKIKDWLPLPSAEVSYQI
jgi:hypothetical protein